MAEVKKAVIKYTIEADAGQGSVLARAANAIGDSAGAAKNKLTSLAISTKKSAKEFARNSKSLKAWKAGASKAASTAVKLKKGFRSVTKESKAARKTFVAVEKSARKLRSILKKVQAVLHKLRGTATIAAFAIKQVGARAKEATSGIRKFGSSVGGGLKRLAKFKPAAIAVTGALAALAAAALAVGAAFKTTFDFAAELKETRELANRFRLTADEFKQFTFAASQLNVEFDVFTEGIGEMEKVLGELSVAGTGPAKEGFDALGLSIKDFEGLTAQESFLKLQDAIASTEDETTALFAATKVFGETEGGSMFPVIRKGSAAMREQLEIAKKLGIGIDKELSDKLDKFNKSSGASSAAMETFRSALAKGLLPIITKVQDMFVKWIGTNGDFINQDMPKFFRQMETRLESFSGVLEALGPILGFIMDLMLDAMTTTADGLSFAIKAFNDLVLSAKVSVRDDLVPLFLNMLDIMDSLGVSTENSREAIKRFTEGVTSDETKRDLEDIKGEAEKAAKASEDQVSQEIKKNQAIKAVFDTMVNQNQQAIKALEIEEASTTNAKKRKKIQEEINKLSDANLLLANDGKKIEQKQEELRERRHQRLLNRLREERDAKAANRRDDEAVERARAIARRQAFRREKFDASAFAAPTSLGVTAPEGSKEAEAQRRRALRRAPMMLEQAFERASNVAPQASMRAVPQVFRDVGSSIKESVKQVTQNVTQNITINAKSAEAIEQLKQMLRDMVRDVSDANQVPPTP